MNLCYNCFKEIPEGKGPCPYCGFDLSENPGVHDVITVTASTPEQTKTFKVLVRFDADADIRYYKNGGILPMVVRKKLKGA